MPLTAFVLAYLLSPTAAIAVGLIILAACPSGVPVPGAAYRAGRRLGQARRFGQAAAQVLLLLGPAAGKAQRPRFRAGGAGRQRRLP